MVGYPDRPIESKIENNFGTDSYVEVVSNFILTCETPMTIAIQGDWGTGKTSMMNMIKESIKNDSKEEIVDVWFNTWQYSQFNLGDQLPFLLLNKLVDKISLKDNSSISELKSLIKKGVRVASQIGVGIVSQGSASLNFDEFNVDEIEQLISIKEKFEENIKQRLSGKGNNARVVIFVDDLDRLQPQKAVEVLETMKIFLDCEKCVFVLAVDYDVVARGVKAKYGDAISDEKGRSFFDKIIQLPFKMPVAKYDIDSYLHKLLSNIWGSVEKDELEDITDYREIIEQSIGKNPRSIKRTVNSFTIINNVAEKEHKLVIDNEEMLKQQRKVLFVLLCMQLSFEQLYNYILEQSTDIAANGLKGLKEVKNDASAFAAILSENYKEDIDLDSDILKSNQEMLDMFIKWSEDLLREAGKLNFADALVEILSLSAITASDTKEIKTKTVRNYEKIPFNGHEYSKAQLPRAVVERYVKENSVISLEELQRMFDWNSVSYGVIRLANDPEIDIKNIRPRYAKVPVHVDNLDIDIVVWSVWGTSNRFDEYKKTVLSKYGVDA